MAELKPCPLCKCRAIYEVEREDLYIGHYPQIFCNGCKMTFEIQLSARETNQCVEQEGRRWQMKNG